jgi:hypothetical protein
MVVSVSGNWYLKSEVDKRETDAFHHIAKSASHPRLLEADLASGWQEPSCCPCQQGEL